MARASMTRRFSPPESSRKRFFAWDREIEFLDQHIDAHLALCAAVMPK